MSGRPAAPDRRRLLLLASGLGLAACGQLPQLQATPDTALRLLPAPELDAQVAAAPREFRAVWVASVANIDWPSRKGLSSEQQQAEMRALLDRAQRLQLNAIILQVRPSADALYASALEPWSEYLSGSQGQAPEPFYDPLALWVAEAHRRGLELHAWFNPFRARQGSASSVPHASHLSRSQPQWVRSYGEQLWLDPGEPGAAEHSLAVIEDVLRRYDIDGVHLDDYFYPYPVMDASGRQELDFPDDAPWQRYQQDGGTLGRADWRRQNVDRLVQRIAERVHRIKPWVRVGISPFGIGKPALRPEGIAGFSQYDKLYADVERWLAEGWLDYLVPQLYWPIAQKAQAFATLLDYWHGQNPLGRHIWPGLFSSKVTEKADSWPVEELLEQIALLRAQRPGSGHAHFSMVALSQNRRGLSDALQDKTYAQAALVPATPWLSAEGALPEAAAGLVQAASGGGAELLLAPGPLPGQRHAVWLRRDGQWRFHSGSELRLPLDGVDALLLSAVDRLGREGPRRGWLLQR